MSPTSTSTSTRDPATDACDVATFREAGHRLIDRMADYRAEVDRRPVSTGLDAAELDGLLAEALPTGPTPESEVWDDVWRRTVPESIHLAHPMYMGHQVAPPLPHAVLADALASLLNQSIAVREMSPTATSVERTVVGWLRGTAGFPDDADGTLVSGGSAANLTALLAARRAVLGDVWTRGVGARDAGGVILVSEHTHYSIERAAGVLGIGTDNVIAVASSEGRMSADGVSDTLDAVSRNGRRVLAVVATAGSTATGRVDDLAGIADVCAERGVWMHVDGAHGASFLLSDSVRRRLRGIERADSLAWDPHKMLFMPISAGVVLLRDHRHLDAAFRQTAPYLFHADPAAGRPDDIGARTFQCSRRFDALKLWVCLRIHGTGHLGRLMDRTVDNAAYLYDRLVEADDFEPAHRPETNILCFRHLPAGIGDGGRTDSFQMELRRRYNASGRGWITTTVLDGRRVLRVTLINPRTGPEHLDALLDGLRETAAELLTASGPPADG